MSIEIFCYKESEIVDSLAHCMLRLVQYKLIWSERLIIMPKSNKTTYFVVS